MTTVNEPLHIIITTLNRFIEATHIFIKPMLMNTGPLPNDLPGRREPLHTPLIPAARPSSA